jgi:basic membrane protein A
MTKRVDVAVYDTIADVLDGRFHGGIRAFGLADQGVDYVHTGPHATGLSPELVQRVERLRQDVIEGRVKVPTE